MKNLSLFILLISFNFCIAQISTTRMNDFRINKSLEEIESDYGKKLELSKKPEDWMYTGKVIDKGAEINFSFSEYTEDNGEKKYHLLEIFTTSPNIKTLSKLGVGSSLDDLWKAYKNYSISIWQEWDSDTEKYSPTKRIFQLNDYEAGTALYFHLQNDKVYKISLSIFEGC